MVIGLVAAGAWISLIVIAVALCQVGGRADEKGASAFVDADTVRAALSHRASSEPVSRESARR